MIFKAAFNLLFAVGLIALRVLVAVGSWRELALVEMPIAGLMSQERAEIVAAKAAKLTEAMRTVGCNLNNAYMQHSLLALVVIPELRISDIGLIDVTRFERTDVLIDAAV